MSSLLIREFPHLTGECCSLQQDRLEKALSYANQNYEKMKSTLPVQHHQPSQKPTDSSSCSSNSDTSSLPSTISLLSRVYVGNIHFDIKEPELASIFRQFGGIKGINLSYESSSTSAGGANHHKGFGFVEFDNTEAPVIAIAQMEGVFCAGRALKMGRPSNFPKEFPTSIPSPSANSIYLTNINEGITRQDLEELAQSIGKVKRIILPVVATSTNNLLLLPETSYSTKHKGYCWIEFQEPRTVKRAIRLLNGQFLGGQKLYACACTTDLFKQVNESTSTHDLWPRSNDDGKKRAFSPLSIQNAPIIALKGLCMAHETQMMTKQEQDAFLRDVAQECAKYGELAEELRWFVDDRPEFLNQVHFFVRYSTPEQADYALAKMNGRFFGGRSVQVVKYPLIRFEIGDFYLT